MSEGEIIEISHCVVILRKFLWNSQCSTIFHNSKKFRGFKNDRSVIHKNYFRLVCVVKEGASNCFYKIVKNVKNCKILQVLSPFPLSQLTTKPQREYARKLFKMLPRHPF